MATCTPMPQSDVNLQLKTSSLMPSNPSTGWSALSLGLARILHVYYEEMKCTIEVVQGEFGRQKFAGVEMTMAGAGARHFLGAIPEIGDYCVVGWVANNNTKADKKSPVILTWMTRTSFLGHDWLPVQDFAPEEQVLETSKDRAKLEAVAGRTRFKMRHMEPGNVVASSSQGSDLVLDESALLTNRRANEIRLRDQDQAIVMRSLQQFHAMAGARVYSGMVQRDARTLPTELWSDGSEWAQVSQLNEEGEPLDTFGDSDTAPLTITPHKLFLKEGSPFQGKMPSSLNPYSFFLEANLIDSSDQYIGEKGVLTYGGKSILRVGQAGEEVKSDALTEYRVELTHTSDGTLPVTEQTDGFDSDRVGENPPFVEFVLGSVVGNDPFGNSDQYGTPLGVDFSTGRGALVSQIDSLFDQAATLIKVTPLTPDSTVSFSSFSKRGNFSANIGSSSREAARVHVVGGANFTLGSSLVTSADRTELVSRATGLAKSISAPDGGISVSSGGSIDGDIGIDVKARKTISLQSDVALRVLAPIVDFSNVKSIRLSSEESLVFEGGRNYEVRASDQKEVISGSKQTLVAGPTDGLPTNAQGVEVTIATSPATGSVGGTVKKETIVVGDEEKTTQGVGDRTTQVSVGKITNLSLTGSVVQQAGGNKVEVGAVSGCEINAVVGNVSMTSVTGLVTVTGISIGLRSIGPVSIEAKASILGGVAGAANGPIMCGSDIHPLIGKPYLVLGMPPRTQVLASIY